jgi:phage terminase large subunit-like protein
MIDVKLPKMHGEQRRIDKSTSKNKVVRAGRRGGKTTYGARKAAKQMFADRRVLLASPSQKQVDAFWEKLNAWFYYAIEAGRVLRDKQKRILTFPHPKHPGRIECRTARFPDDLRGGYGDDIILDEAWMLDESALDEVIFPMLLDNDGNLDIYSTPKAGSWFNRLCEDILQGNKPGFEMFHFPSDKNPHISHDALIRLKGEMTERAWEEEILAMLLDEVKGALWRRAWIRRAKIEKDDCQRIVIAVDPAVSSNKKSNETGIVVCGKVSNGLYAILEDASGVYTPKDWADKVVALYDKWQADKVVGEKNNGGDLVESNLKQQAEYLPVKLVWASKGKISRAEPIAGIYEPKEENPGRVVHAGVFEELETQMVTWTIEADFSPDRMDALVWGMTELSSGSDSLGVF